MRTAWIVSLCATMGGTAASQLRILGESDGFTTNNIIAYALSDDGQAFIGSYAKSVWYETEDGLLDSYSIEQAFRWTEADGLLNIDGFERPFDGSEHFSDFSFPIALTSNGGVVLGSSNGRAFRWTAEGGTVDLGFEPASIGRYGMSMSADGQVIVGSVGVGVAGYRAVRYEDGVLTEFDAAWSERDSAITTDISADGRWIVGSEYALQEVGNSGKTQAVGRAVRWSENGESLVLDSLLADPSWSTHAEAVSDDGGRIAGTVHDSGAGSRKAFVWDEAGGMRFLDGDLTVFEPGSESDIVSSVTAMSGDGSVLIGRYIIREPYFTTTDFIWTEETGVRVFKDYLQEEHGFEESDWMSGRIIDVSADGRTFLGSFLDDSERRFFLVTIPSPGSAALAALGGVLLMRRRAGR